MVNISSIDIREDSGELVVSSHIQMPAIEDEAWYRLPLQSQTDPEAAADAFFTIGLILAMGSDGILTMDQPVSKRLLHSARDIQDILVGWYPKRLRSISEINVSARDRDRDPIQGSTVSCFTGGADSFDTLINNEDNIDALLYIHGFDVSLRRTEIRETTSAHLQDIAKMTGKELIEGSTNIRKFLNLAGPWPTITHGASLSAVGHLLSARFGRLIVPASHTYSDTFAWGSHPLLDHLYSSIRLAVVHDGAGSTRVQKTINLADYPAAQQHLRVCWQNTGKYNCGRCGKCTRTMIALQLYGALPKFVTFDSEVDLDAVRALKISGRSDRSFVLENLQYAEEQGDARIAEALRGNLAEYDARTSKRTKQEKRTKVLSTEAISIKMRRMEKQNKALDARLYALEKSIAETSGSITKLERLWPIRSWKRFAKWRRVLRRS